MSDEDNDKYRVDVQFNQDVDLDFSDEDDEDDNQAPVSQEHTPTEPQNPFGSIEDTDLDTPLVPQPIRDPTPDQFTPGTRSQLDPYYQQGGQSRWSQYRLILPMLIHRNLSAQDTHLLTHYRLPQGLDARDARNLVQIGYIPLEQLGAGCFAYIYRCIPSGGPSGSVAIKVMKVGKSRINEVEERKVNHERSCIEQINSGGGHRNVLQIEVRYASGTPLRGYFISDYSPIGDLFQYFQRQNRQNRRVWVPMPENQCRYIFEGVARGLQYMHDQGVAHGDLKPHNILLFWRAGPPDPNSKADRDFPSADRMIPKLCDFGNSWPRHDSDPPGKIMCDRTTCTLYYAAPESWFRTGNVPEVYDIISAECFSLGNNMLAMLLGGHPYNSFMDSQESLVSDRRNRSIIQQKRDHTYTRHLCANFHAMLRDVLVGLLDPNPNTRMSLTTFLEHPWVRQTSVGDTPRNRQELLPSEMRPTFRMRPRSGTFERGEHRGESIELSDSPPYTEQPSTRDQPQEQVQLQTYGQQFRFGFGHSSRGQSSSAVNTEDIQVFQDSSDEINLFHKHNVR